MPRLEHGQDRRQDDESGACCAEKPRSPPAQAALALRPSQTQRHWHHAGQHRETGHQDSDADGSVRLLWASHGFAALDPLRSAKVTSRMAFARPPMP